MSQEQPPIRSRRELRQARDAHLEHTGRSSELADSTNSGASASASSRPSSSNVVPGIANEGKAVAAPAKRVRRVADSPVDAKPAVERSSQARARDRAALRAIKELADKEQQLSQGGPPTRRQLRLQQLQEEVAPGTSAIPVVVPGSGPRTSGIPVRPSGVASIGKLSDGGVRVTAGPPPGAPQMTVEQALMAREFLIAQANNQSNKLEHIAAMESVGQKVPASGTEGPGVEADPVDSDALAEQIAQAEREAILNKRAVAKQKLAEQNSRSPVPARVDPSAASNLAMVTPLEFVKVPGVERPVMKPPSTSFVPLVTSSGPKLAADQGTPGKSRIKRGRSGVLARAEAAANAAGQQSASGSSRPEAEAFAETVERPPVAANSAYGIEPLDAATAGLGRARRNQILVLGFVAVGVVALLAGIVMITSGLSR